RGEHPPPMCPSPSSADLPAANLPALGPIRLLVVADSPEGRRSPTRLLSLDGFEVTAVGDGASAFEALRAGPPPHAVLTDLVLPDTGGREVARAANALRPRPFIGLITGWSFSDDDEDLREVGIDRLFLKPLAIDVLVA